MSAWTVHGQGHITSALSRNLAQGKLGHAYLLVGPPRIGKGTLAVELAQVVNCLGDAPPCGACAQCQRIGRGIHPDVQVIALARDERTGRPRTEIGIDQVRELERAAALGPFEGRCRVFIVDGAEDLSQDAANAMLKTLEEPPSGVLLLLLSSREQAVLPTIQSRCQRLELRPVPEAEMVTLLTSQHNLTQEDARLLARLSAGRMGWALAAAKDPKVLGERQERMERLQEAVDNGLERRFHYSQELATLFARNRKAAQEVLALWLSWWRDILLLKEGTPDLVVNLDWREALEERARRYSGDQVAGIVKEVLATQERLEQNASPRLALDVLMLALPKGQPVRA